MTPPSERLVEDVAVAYFGAIGVPTKRGVDLDDAGERDGPAHILLKARLISALCRLNPALPLETCEDVARTLSRPPQATLHHNNRWFHALLSDGVEVHYRDGLTGDTRGGRARLIDFDNFRKNDVLVVRQ